MVRNQGPGKKPTSAYGFFVKMCYEEHKKKYPNENVQVTEISKKCSEKWKTMTDAEKRRFYELAQKDTERYNAELAAYGEYPKRKRQKKDPNAPKRALSAFFFFSSERRPAVQQSHTEWRVGQVAQELGRQWKDITPEEKQRFEDMASRDRGRYEADMKDFKAGLPLASGGSAASAAFVTNASTSAAAAAAAASATMMNSMVNSTGQTSANAVQQMQQVNTQQMQQQPPPQQQQQQFQQQPNMLGQQQQFQQQVITQQQQQQMQQQMQLQQQQLGQQLTFVPQPQQQQQMTQMQQQQPLNAAQVAAAVQNMQQQQQLGQPISSECMLTAAANAISTAQANVNNNNQMMVQSSLVDGQ